MPVVVFPLLLPRWWQIPEVEVLAARRTYEKVPTDTPLPNMTATVLHSRRSTRR